MTKYRMTRGHSPLRPVNIVNIDTGALAAVVYDAGLADDIVNGACCVSERIDRLPPLSKQTDLNDEAKNGGPNWRRGRKTVGKGA